MEEKEYKEAEDLVPQDVEIQIRSNEYNATVIAIREALANIQNSDQWPTHENVFASIVRKHMKKDGPKAAS